MSDSAGATETGPQVGAHGGDQTVPYASSEIGPHAGAGSQEGGHAGAVGGTGAGDEEGGHAGAAGGTLAREGGHAGAVADEFGHGAFADEFQWLADNAAEAGLPWSGPPLVRRAAAKVAAGREVSSLVWGREPAELVLLHGGAQNAHTWDSVALALNRPLVALDLPGHGHSTWRDNGDYRVEALGADVAAALRQLAPDARVVVGMSLGGLVALAIATTHPALVRRLALVDITPGTDDAKAEPILAFLAGPERFASFEEMLARTVAFNPTRSVPSLRRGIIHNAQPDPDGSWRWRWDPALTRRRRAPGGGFQDLWPALGGLEVPLLLLRGARSRVVSDADVAELRRFQPEAAVEVVAGAGHSIQGDQPVALAARLARFASD